MALAFEQYGNNEGSSVTKTRKKAKVPVDHAKMAAGYQDMANINTEEAGSWEVSWNDKMDLYGSDPNIPW